MKVSRRSLLCLVIGIFISSSNAFAVQWCGDQLNNNVEGGASKRNCIAGGASWTVQMNVFSTNASIGWSENDCVSYEDCSSALQWKWNNAVAWSQLFISKDGFCAANNSVSNTKEFNISFSGNFTGTSGIQRMAIVSWGKTVDDCNWTTNNLFELYIHEQSFNEGPASQAYNWCTYKGTSPECSGSTYELYFCDIESLPGKSVRCWRNEPRTEGTTDVDCLWEAWKNVDDGGIISDEIYYYFAEVGSEVGPGASGTFDLSGHDMVRIAEGAGGGEIVTSISNGHILAGGKQFKSAALYTLSGQSKWSSSVSSNNYSIETYGFESGLYVLQLFGEDDSVEIKKIVLR